MPEPNPAPVPWSWTTLLQAFKAEGCRELPGAGVMRRAEPPMSCGRHFHPEENSLPQAAVAVVLCEAPSGAEVPLVLRPESMPQHAGQVGFPGGKLHPGESTQQAALRELREELGLEPQRVQPLFELTPVRLFVSRFAVRPWLLATQGPVPLCPCPKEVKQVLWASLEELIRPEALTTELRCVWGQQVPVPGYRVQGHFVWGATALILTELAELFRRIRPVLNSPNTHDGS